MPRLRSLACLVLLVACGGGGGSSDGSTGGTTGSSTSSASATSTTVTGGGTSEASSGPMTTSATGTSPTTGPGESSTTATTASTVGESSTGTPGTSDASTGTTGDATTGGLVGACEPITGNYGPCDALIGYAFVDGSCQLVSGCSCEPDCEFFFDDPVACASTCAAAGECQLGDIQGGGIGPDDVGPGSFCDEVDACVNLPELKELFPELVCEPGQPCGGENCHLLWQGQLTQEQWTQICAASLLPGVDELYCMVFGP